MGEGRELAQVKVTTDPPYVVSVGPGAAGLWRSAVSPADRVAIVADRHVYDLHAAALGSIDDLALRLLPRGEACKTWDLVGATLEFLANAGLSRRSIVVAFGGGAACDHAGLAASLFKRGCAVVHLPTTLLAQVDASVGGKTAINMAAGKNLAGTFHQPAAVLADTGFLATLPDEELRSGLGEVLKTALLGGEQSMLELERSADDLLARDPQTLARVVRACVATKARVVAADPTERGLRRSLNLGHTFAHAIEHVAGYGVVPHGVAVAAGLGLALRAGVELGTTEASLAERVAGLAARLGLPKGLADLRSESGLSLPAEDLQAGLAQDKKGNVGAPEFVLLDGLGAARAGVALDAQLLAQLL